ncbi:hypothetical protein [Salininema proteolyticum]|uniref:TrbC/VIRB2 family protein n=1 Tax=Salininema proteolyticum TaxID=1607685 RepID=A0ABV8U2S3_9ACTN
MKETLWLAASEAQLLAQDDKGAELDTSGIIGFFLSKIAPILLAILGIIFIARANKGEVSRVLTSSTIAILGIAFIAGAGLLIAFGGSLVDVMFTESGD